MQKTFHWIALCAVAASLVSVEPGAATAHAAHSMLPKVESLQQRLLRQAGSSARIVYNPATGKVRFLGTAPSQGLAPSQSTAMAPAQPEEVARLFLREYGELFGIADADLGLKQIRVKTVDAKLPEQRTFTRYQQQHLGIPVFGGEVIVQTTDAQRAVSAVFAKIIPNMVVATTPRIAAHAAQATARAMVARSYGRDAAALTVSTPELWIYNPLVFNHGFSKNSLVWRMDVSAGELSAVKELVLVDAQFDVVALHFNQIAHAKVRRVYDKNNVRSNALPGTLVRSEGQGPVAGNVDANNAYDFAGDTYDYFSNNFGRDSIDGKGMAIISTVRFCSADPQDTCPLENAFWTGTQMVYGAGFASADDVVAHELAHGVTQFESNLFYYMQSGAINEALSDIFGEYMDLVNGKGNDAPDQRWRMGEDVPGGAIRDMKNPSAFTDPDRVSSSDYKCGFNQDYGDSGGVHSNSGIANKAAYLMTDGDTFNGQTITGLSINKAQKIWYEAATNLLGSASDYADLANALRHACSTLTGKFGITGADCGEVNKSVLAVEMEQQPAACATPQAAVCPGNLTKLTQYVDNMENIVAKRWISGTLQGGNSWFHPQLPDATYATSGIYNLWGEDRANVSNTFIQMTSNIKLPAGTSYLRFNHAYRFDYGPLQGQTTLNYFDGGIMEYSTNNGTSWTNVSTLPEFLNGYNQTLFNATNPADRSPLANQRTFAGTSNGYVSSRINLTPLANQNVRFRFRIGTDSSLGDYGWFIDDLEVYICGDISNLTNKVPLPLVLK
jgi:Zn-dependent metalloprotease